MTIEEQKSYLEKGESYVKLVRPCTIGDGIVIAEDMLAGGADRDVAEITRFIPASGAATRMFGFLSASLSAMQKEGVSSLGRLHDPAAHEAARFFLENIHLLAFYDKLEKSGYGQAPDDSDKLELVLTGKGLGLPSLPKALIDFHKYETGPCTAAMEQVNESVRIFGEANTEFHFTVSPEHMQALSSHLNEKFPAIKFSFSVQDPSTDTVALDEAGALVTDESGGIFKRPGGHGALLDNLGRVKGDAILIKNIDNCSYYPTGSAGDRELEKLIDVFLQLREKKNTLLDMLEAGPATEVLRDAASFIFKYTGRVTEQADKGELYALLNRPFRVCGMVKNTGEPGGGPFWVNKDGVITMQIIEEAQVDKKDAGQMAVFNSATHFNPVIMACDIKDNSGAYFDLSLYKDNDMAIISRKPHKGGEIRVLELPGLWNGAMAGWNTVFMEMDMAAFNPVKTVNDLFRPQHLSPESQLLVKK